MIWGLWLRTGVLGMGWHRSAVGGGIWRTLSPFARTLFGWVADTISSASTMVMDAHMLEELCFFFFRKLVYLFRSACLFSLVINRKKLVLIFLGGGIVQRSDA